MKPPTSPTIIRVLLAEDSPTVRAHLVSMLDGAAGLRVVGEARDGEEVIALAAQLRPHVVSMDINMPRLNGLEATRQIMMAQPLPIVVVSNLLERSVDLAFEAIQAGALAVVAKPPARNAPDFAEKQAHLVRTLVAMSDVRVIRRGRTGMLAGAPGTGPLQADRAALPATQPAPRPTGPLIARALPPEVIAVGASAGGPSALASLLRRLPPGALTIPVVVVQHMAQEFIPGLARWLSSTTGHSVRVAADGNRLTPGVVHLSPGTAHLTLMRTGGGLAVRLLADQGAHRYQPSVDALFYSVAEACGGAAVGVILTGMGDDGADGLLAMRQAGARTLAQDQSSAVVYGMPGAAVRRGAVEQVASPAALSAAILRLL